MTPIAPEEETLRELEDDTRRAWSHYSEQVQELTGEEYERVESESWTELQTELRRLEDRREQVKPAVA